MDSSSRLGLTGPWKGGGDSFLGAAEELTQRQPGRRCLAHLAREEKHKWLLCPYQPLSLFATERWTGAQTKGLCAGQWRTSQASGLKSFVQRKGWRERRWVRKTILCNWTIGGWLSSHVAKQANLCSISTIHVYCARSKQWGA